MRKHALDFTPELHQSRNTDRSVLTELDEHVDLILDRYDLNAARDSSQALLLHQLYGSTRNAEPDDPTSAVPSAVVAALIAAEVEFRGPLRLTDRQVVLLAEEYESLGADFARFRLHCLAVRAYQRAKALYRINEDDEGEDRCGMQLARSRTRTHDLAWRRWAGDASFVLCGHGYRPLRLLGWVLVELLVFTLAGLALRGGTPVPSVVYMTTTSVLGPLGPGNLEPMSGYSRIIFALESWVGAVSMSVFFALLVRRWFRL